MRRQRSRRSLVGLGAALWVLAAAAGAWGETAAEAGRAWLLSSVEADGAWRSERDPSGLRSTAAVLSALGAERKAPGRFLPPGGRPIQREAAAVKRRLDVERFDVAPFRHRLDPARPDRDGEWIEEGWSAQCGR
jgi:hypothetical protein